MTRAEKKFLSKEKTFRATFVSSRLHYIFRFDPIARASKVIDANVTSEIHESFFFFKITRSIKILFYSSRSNVSSHVNFFLYANMHGLSSSQNDENIARVRFTRGLTNLTELDSLSGRGKICARSCVENTQMYEKRPGLV